MPDEPTIPMAPAQPPDNEPEEQDDDDRKNKGGRRSNKELARENDRLAAENAALRTCLADFAAIPDDATKPGTHVLYILSRGGVEHKVLACHVRTAQKLLRS